MRDWSELSSSTDTGLPGDPAILKETHGENNFLLLGAPDDDDDDDDDDDPALHRR